MDWLGQARTGNAKQAELGSDMLCSALYGPAGMVRLGYALLGPSWNGRRFLSTLGC